MASFDSGDQQLEATRRDILFASIFLLMLLIIGTLGYVVIEQWSFFDGLYMTFLTLTTIGFNEVAPLSTAGRLFTMAISVFGIGAVAFIATRSTQLFLSTQEFRKRQMKRMIAKLQDHYIVCGYGRLGERICADLQAAGVPFVLIEYSEKKAAHIEAETDYLFIQDNAEEENTLIRAGIEKAKGIIITLPEDHDNVFVTLIARELNRQLFILARTNNSKNTRKMIRAGADKVVSPYEIGADRMAQVILQPTVDRFMERVLKVSSSDVSLEEVVVEKGANIHGKTIAEADFRTNYGALVVAITLAGENEIQFNPRADVLLTEGLTLIVIGAPDMVHRLRLGCSGK